MPKIRGEHVFTAGLVATAMGGGYLIGHANRDHQAKPPAPAPKEQKVEHRLSYECSTFKVMLHRYGAQRLLTDGNLVRGNGLYTTIDGGRDLIADNFQVTLQYDPTEPEYFVSAYERARSGEAFAMLPNESTTRTWSHGVHLSLLVSDKVNEPAMARALICQEK